MRGSAAFECAVRGTHLTKAKGAYSARGIVHGGRPGSPGCVPRRRLTRRGGGGGVWGISCTGGRDLWHTRGGRGGGGLVYVTA